MQETQVPQLITLHLGSRYPKRYLTELQAAKQGLNYDPTDPPLSEEQPGFVKCRVKIRLSKDSNIQQRLDEIRTVWGQLDHQQPVWVAGTNAFYVQLISEMFNNIEIRSWEPAEGDD